MIRVRRRSLALGERIGLRGGRVRSVRIAGPRRWPRILVVLFALGIALVGLGLAAGATARTIGRLASGGADLGPVPDPVGPRIDTGLDLCLIIDDSGSTASTDPSFTRYEAARFLVEFLAEQAEPGVDDRICVVHFGSSATRSLALPLTLLHDRAAINDALVPPLDQGGTNFVAANTLASELMAGSDPSRHKVVVIFTDGQPSAGTDDAVFAAISRSLDGLPRWSTHLIALDDGDEYDDIHQQWERLGLGSTQRLSQLEGRHLEHAFAHIVVDELSMTWGS